MMRSTLLPLHIAAGLVAIISGYIAIFVVKGLKTHRRSGMIFVYAMMFMSSSATVLGIAKGQTFNVMQGVLTFYLVVTAVLTVRDQTRQVRLIGIGAMLLAFFTGVYDIFLGFEASTNTSGMVDGISPAGIFPFAALAILAAAGDLRMLISGKKGAPRLVRHLWRMCVALFIAAGSFFLGQAKVFPESIRIVPTLAIPALMPLVLLIYWLIRVRFTKWYRLLPDNRFRRGKLASGPS